MKVSWRGGVFSTCYIFKTTGTRGKSLEICLNNKPWSFTSKSYLKLTQNGRQNML